MESVKWTGMVKQEMGWEEGKEKKGRV